MFSQWSASVIVGHAIRAPVTAVTSFHYQTKRRPSSWNRQKKLTRLSFCIALAVLAFATVTVSAQEADGESESSGLIAFFSTRDGDYEIYLMNPDGSGLTRLTNYPADDSYLSWSPDGSQIAFTSDRGGSADIYLTNVDGSDDTQLTDSPGVSSHPSWSPDGQRIAFESDRDGNFEIYVMVAGRQPYRFSLQSRRI